MEMEAALTLLDQLNADITAMNVRRTELDAEF